jgi:ActR/RegA family two-component response regulator
MSFYVIIENGEAYPTGYTSYAAAVKAVKSKYCEYLCHQVKQLDMLEDIESVLADVNVPENKETNKTYLYIEKGIHITIYKIPVESSSVYY